MNATKRRVGAEVAKIEGATAELRRAGEDHRNYSCKAREPASPAQIAAYEEHVGIALPPTYRAFLELHNGYEGLSFPGSMLSTEDTLPGGAWFDRIRKWKERSRKYGDENAANGIVIANMGQNNRWVYMDPSRRSSTTNELVIVEWEPESTDEYATLVRFFVECLATIRFGINESKRDK